MKLKSQSGGEGRPMASWLDGARAFGLAATARMRRKPDNRGPAGEAGAALVETALSAAVMFSILIGLFQVCLAFYSFTFVSDAAREASRWAMVRGSTSCTNSGNLLPGCNAAQSDVLGYVDSLGYPGLSANNLTVNVSWLTLSTASGSAQWSACSAAPCNKPGNEVQVQVLYKLHFYIPFWKNSTGSVGSQSTMVIQQ